MSDQGTATAADVELPKPSTVLREIEFRPRRTEADAFAVDAAPVPKTYHILRTNQRDPDDAADLAALGFAAAAGDDFVGHDRKAAKISIAAVATEDFADVAALIGSLSHEDAMIHHHPKITRDEDSDRVEEERRNIRVQGFLWAAKREANDNDYHLIVGRHPDEPRTFITMEISGLPPEDSTAFNVLRSARNAYEEFFKGDLPTTDGYDFIKPPMPVEIEGSLFFDVTHASGPHDQRPGPDDLRPDMPVVWEVHPITRIVLDP